MPALGGSIIIISGLGIEDRLLSLLKISFKSPQKNLILLILFLLAFFLASLTAVSINSIAYIDFTYLDKNIEITATCVRIPVLVSHAESINIEFENEFTIEKIRNALNSAEGCEVIDERKDGGYITPLEAEGKNETFISRIRKDNSNNKAVNLWCVSDNLLRGAALNAVEIAEAYIKNK